MKMKAQDFIIKKLNELAVNFDGIRIRYEFRKNTLTHIIEVLPLDLYENDLGYLAEEDRIEDEFESLFPEDNIVFISEGSLTEIVEPYFEVGYNKIIIDYVPSETDKEILESWELISTLNCYAGELEYALAA